MPVHGFSATTNDLADAPEPIEGELLQADLPISFVVFVLISAAVAAFLGAVIGAWLDL